MSCRNLRTGSLIQNGRLGSRQVDALFALRLITSQFRGGPIIADGKLTRTKTRNTKLGTLGTEKLHKVDLCVRALAVPVRLLVSVGAVSASTMNRRGRLHIHNTLNA